MHIATPLYTNGQCNPLPYHNNTPTSCFSSGGGTTRTKAGDCLGAPCTFYNDCSDNLSRSNGMASILELESVYVA